MVLPADKRRAAVVMDRVEYDKKSNGLFSDTTIYQKLKKFPTIMCTNKVIETLKKYKDEGVLSKENYH